MRLGHWGTKTALRFLSATAPPRDLNYGDWSRPTNRFASVLKKLGVAKGECLFILAGRIPELYIAMLGSLKNGTVVSPLFSAFGPEPISWPLLIRLTSIVIRKARIGR